MPWKQHATAHEPHAAVAQQTPHHPTAAVQTLVLHQTLVPQQTLVLQQALVLQQGQGQGPIVVLTRDVVPMLVLAQVLVQLPVLVLAQELRMTAQALVLGLLLLLLLPAHQELQVQAQTQVTGWSCTRSTHTNHQYVNAPMNLSNGSMASSVPARTCQTALMGANARQNTKMLLCTELPSEVPNSRLMGGGNAPNLGHVLFALLGNCWTCSLYISERNVADFVMIE